MLELNAWDFQIIDTLMYACVVLTGISLLFFAGSYLRGKIRERKWKL